MDLETAIRFIRSAATVLFPPKISSPFQALVVGIDYKLSTSNLAPDQVEIAWKKVKNTLENA
jgi:hypothetical protein